MTPPCWCASCWSLSPRRSWPARDFGGRLPKATLTDNIGRHSKLRSQFHVRGDRVGDEAVFLHLGHDRSGSRDGGLRSQDQRWPNADFNNPVFAVDIFKQAFSAATSISSGAQTPASPLNSGGLPISMSGLPGADVRPRRAVSQTRL